MDYKETDFSKLGEGFFPGLVGIEVTQMSSSFAAARMEVKKLHLAANGHLHTGGIVTLADTIAGYACLYNLPDKATSFTTIELKSNFLGTVKNGAVKATAMLEYAGKTTQIWDVTIKNAENESTIALFRCTQLILY